MTRRLVLAAAVALLLACGAATAAPLVLQDINPCASLTPDDTFWWWFYGCGKDAAGGGGSGAS